MIVISYLITEKWYNCGEQRSSALRLCNNTHFCHHWGEFVSEFTGSRSLKTLMQKSGAHAKLKVWNLDVCFVKLLCDLCSGCQLCLWRGRKEIQSLMDRKLASSSLNSPSRLYNVNIFIVRRWRQQQPGFVAVCRWLTPLFLSYIHARPPEPLYKHKLAHALSLSVTE